MNYYYYLHENGDLICKQNADPADFRESDFVRMFWLLDTENRATVWDLLVEALALGANAGRVKGLATKWRCDDLDGNHYASYLGVNVTRDGNAWMAALPSFENIQESPCGFGLTKLEAFSELAKALGFRAQKTWGQSLRQLISKTGQSEGAAA